MGEGQLLVTCGAEAWCHGTDLGVSSGQRAVEERPVPTCQGPFCHKPRINTRLTGGYMQV